MKSRERVVFDTNALVSRLLFPQSVPGQAVRLAMDSAQLLVSEATVSELAEVLSRPKFDRYVSVSERRHFLRLIGRIVDFVPVVYPIRVCRDQKDDKFLELALAGAADVVVTGDSDLLVLHPFRSVPILAPAAYLSRSQALALRQLACSIEVLDNPLAAG